MEPSLQTQADLHAHIRDLLCNQHSGTLSPSRIWSDCWLILNKIQVIVYQYLDNSCEQQQINIQLLYQHVNQNFHNNPQQFDILDPRTLSKIGNFYEAIIIPVIQYFMKQWNTIKSSNVLQNMINECRIDSIQCLCSDNANNIMQQSISNSKFCYKCGLLFHRICFNIPTHNIQYYQCPFCFLSYCLPDRHVLHTIYKSYLPPVPENQTNTSIIHIDWPITRLANNNCTIQLRCVRIGCEYQITWPQLCDIYLDDVISVSYSPLAQNSPLKRRHDHPIIVPIRDLSCSEKIKIREQYAGVSAWHMITVSLVKQKNEKEIFEQLSKDPAHTINQSQSKIYLQKLFWKSNCLQMQQLKISNKCQFYSQKITHPCRSRHCTNHYQPFDLYSFICSSVIAKSSIKRWKCPICGVRAYDIVRDLYLQNAMNQPQNSNKKQTSFVCSHRNIANSQ